jgi:hypothetical protein
MVHFSLHFERDYSKLARVLGAIDPAAFMLAPYVPHDMWSKITASHVRTQSWIERRIGAVDAVIVLIGLQTYTRPLVRNEIAAAAHHRRRLLGLYVNRVPDAQGAVEAQKGLDPFKYVAYDAGSPTFHCYDWVPGEPLPLEKWIG